MPHHSLASSKRCFCFAQSLLTALWIVVLLAFCNAETGAAELLAINRALPAKGEDQSNQRLHAAIAARKGQPLLINFWASWCETCREEMPALQRLAQRWQGRGLQLITVAVADTPKQTQDYLEKIGVQLPVIHDPEQQIIQRWGVLAVPTTVILDKRHRIRLFAQGDINWDAASIDRQLQPLFN